MKKTLQPHRIESIRPLPDMRLNIAFADGWQTGVDISAFIAAHPILQPLLASERFSQVSVGEWGFDVTWDNADLAIAATTLRQMAEAQTGGPAHSFEQWMRRNQLSLAEAAESLGMTRRMVTHYRAGSRPIPKTVLLACKGWEADHQKP